MVQIDLSGAQQFFTQAGPDYAAAARAHEVLSSGSGLGADFTGWLALPRNIRETELDRILAAAETIRARSGALVVIGIGGSYLGARGAIELLKPVRGEGDPEVFFLGNGLSADALCDTLTKLGDRDFDVNVISKSGTTLEPAVSFRIFRELLEKKYGADADAHIFATTDARRGVLKSLADANGWESFVVPDDVGGRFSIFSAVGLLPMAVAGIDVRRVIDAAIREMEALPLSARQAFWENEFSKCIRCYACRNVCPACNCRECYADQYRTGWQGKQLNTVENRVYGLTRAYHVGDRCIECGECERVCPMDLPIMLQTGKMLKVCDELYGPYECGLSAEEVPALGTYALGDADSFN